MSLVALTTSAQDVITYTTVNGLISDNVLCLDIDQNDVVWFGTQNGICSFDGSTWTGYTEADGLVDDAVYAIMVDSQGHVYSGTDFGFSIFDGSNWTTYTTDDGLEDNRVKHFFEDSDGLIWIANQDGVSTFDGNSFVNYTTDDGLPFGGSVHVNQDINGDMWLATGLGGCFVFDGTTFTAITSDEGLLSNQARSISVDAGGNKWVGTSAGISVFDAANVHSENHESIIYIPPPDELNPVEDVKVDQYGRVWAAVWVDYLLTVGGVGYYVNGEWFDILEEDGLAGPAVTQMAVDSEGNAWVSTTSGVSKISNAPVNIESPDSEERIALYPNPTNGLVWLGHPLNGPYQIISADGRMIKQAQANHLLSLDFSALPKGMYLLQTENNVARVLVK